MSRNTTNQLLCEEVENENEPNDKEGDGEEKKEFLDCGLDTLESLKNPVSIGIGVVVQVVSLLPMLY